MNRQQRRHAQGKERPGYINLNTITWPWQMTDDECRMMAHDRLRNNLLQTKHPFHHLTDNGAIVEPDPTLEYYLSRLREDEREAIRTQYMPAPDAPKAMPVNRKYYGRDIFERH